MTDLYQRLCALAGRPLGQQVARRIEDAALHGDLVTADAPLLEMIDTIYAQSWRWKATRARRWLRAKRQRAPLR